ncbi:MAG: hypothetical protein ACKVQS_04555 [Fimbriimonadaceae bacterium]
MARLTGVDVTVFDVGGSSVLADLRSAEVVSTTQFADVTPVILAGESREAVKHSVAIRGAFTSTKPGGAKVTHLDVSALTLAGLDYRAVVESGVFEGRMTHEDGSGLGDEWEYPVTVRKEYRARLDMMVDSVGSVALVGKAFGALAGKDVGFSVTINGVVVTVLMKLAKFAHALSAGSRQKWTVELVGSAAVGAVYPTLPTGSASLLEFAFNTPGAGLPIAVDPGAGQPLVSGDFLVEKFGFKFARAAVVESSYDFVSLGAVGLS